MASIQVKATHFLFQFWPPQLQHSMQAKKSGGESSLFSVRNLYWWVRFTYINHVCYFGTCGIARAWHLRQQMGRKGICLQGWGITVHQSLFLQLTDGPLYFGFVRSHEDIVIVSSNKIQFYHLLRNFTLPKDNTYCRPEESIYMNCGGTFQRKENKSLTHKILVDAPSFLEINIANIIVKHTKAKKKKKSVFNTPNLVKSINVTLFKIDYNYN